MKFILFWSIISFLWIFTFNTSLTKPDLFLINLSNSVSSLSNLVLISSNFFYYVKKPAGGEKAKVKLSAKKYNPSTRKHEMFVEKKLPPHSK